MKIHAEKVDKRSIAELVPYARNSRTHSPAQIKQIEKSIQEFGWTVPVLVDEQGTIIAGHGRVLAASNLGIEAVPVVVAAGWTDDQKRAYIIADNKIASNADWDKELLALELSDLKSADYDLGITGFNAKELVQYVAVSKDGLTDEDEVPEPPPEPVSASGDVWLLGAHRVMCGDSIIIDAVEKLMDGAKADMVFTDPPYRMDATGGSNQPIGRSAAKLGEAIKHLCEFDPVAFLAILPKVFNKAKMNAYIFCNKDLVPDYLQWGLTNGFNFNILFWKKPNALPLGGQHRPDVEYLLYFRKGAHWNNGVKEANYSRCMEYGRENSTPHPTMKPVALIENQVLIASPDGGLILDLFGGSGSTLIACEKTDRACRMMELDPKYVDVIIKRWQAFTGKQAVLESSGKTFDEIANARH